MLSISLIVVFSLVLFAYWFRYSCLLILQTRSREGYASQSGAKGLSFAAVQESLRRDQPGGEALDRLHRDLHNDYRILSFLLRHSSDVGVDPIEQHMLMLDYKVMRLWYRLTRRAAPPKARGALEEMSNILGYFAQSVGSGAQGSEA